ncbi:MAG: hypothetical protein KDJ97_07805 [Anaerolineae bacterium]|nr:hypothetical protein [Anaerolineae bacterium]
MTFEETVITHSELTPIQIRTIGAILAAHSITEAAGKVGIDRSTIHRWIAGVPAFNEALTAGRKQLATEVMEKARSTWQAELSAGADSPSPPPGPHQG